MVDGDGSITVFLDGCQVGAEEEGLELLQTLLGITGARSVSAPTGMLLCDGTREWYDPPNAPVQTITLHAGVPPVLPAVGSDSAFVQNGRMLLRSNGSEAHEADIDQVGTMTVNNSCVGCPGNVTKSDIILERSESLGRHLLNLCNFSEPFRIAGLPLAQKTLKITLQFPSASDDLNRSRTFISLSDTLLQDQDFPDIFYRTTPEFRRVVKDLRSHFTSR
jgi:hypothetical protein